MSVGFFQTRLNCWFFVLGLFDSDGCLCYGWQVDACMTVEGTITQKGNFSILVLLKSVFQGSASPKNKNWVIFKSLMGSPKNLGFVQVFSACLNNEANPLFFFEDPNLPETCYLYTSRRFDAILFILVRNYAKKWKGKGLGHNKHVVF